MCVCLWVCVCFCLPFVYVCACVCMEHQSMAVDKAGDHHGLSVFLYHSPAYSCCSNLKQRALAYFHLQT